MFTVFIVLVRVFDVQSLMLIFYNLVRLRYLIFDGPQSLNFCPVVGSIKQDPQPSNRSMSTANKSASLFGVAAGLISFGVGLSYYLVTTSATGATTFGVDFFGKSKKKKKKKIGCPLCRAKTEAVCKDATSNNICCGCLEAKSTVLLECGHICLCKDCYKQVGSYKAPKNV